MLKKLIKLIKYPCVVTYETVGGLIFLLPRYRVLNFFKSNFLKIMGSRIGKRVVFYPGIKIMPMNNLVLDDDVDLAWGVIITTSGGVSIGKRVLIGYNTQIISGNHRIGFQDEKIFNSGHELKPIKIEQDSWIGANVTILPGVIIGEGAVVGAGSVVTKNIPPFHVVGGVPAKTIKIRSNRI